MPARIVFVTDINEALGFPACTRPKNTEVSRMATQARPLRVNVCRMYPRNRASSNAAADAKIPREVISAAAIFHGRAEELN